jgi:hypothetical protein
MILPCERFQDQVSECPVAIAKFIPRNYNPLVLLKSDIRNTKSFPPLASTLPIIWCRQLQNCQLQASTRGALHHHKPGSLQRLQATVSGLAGNGGFAQASLRKSKGHRLPNARFSPQHKSHG